MYYSQQRISIQPGALACLPKCEKPAGSVVLKHIKKVYGALNCGLCFLSPLLNALFFLRRFLSLQKHSRHRSLISSIPSSYIIPTVRHRRHIAATRNFCAVLRGRPSLERCAALSAKALINSQQWSNEHSAA